MTQWYHLARLGVAGCGKCIGRCEVGVGRCVVCVGMGGCGEDIGTCGVGVGGVGISGLGHGWG